MPPFLSLLSPSLIQTEHPSILESSCLSHPDLGFLRRFELIRNRVSQKLQILQKSKYYLGRFGDEGVKKKDKNKHTQVGGLSPERRVSPSYVIALLLTPPRISFHLPSPPQHQRHV